MGRITERTYVISAMEAAADGHDGSFNGRSLRSTELDTVIGQLEQYPKRLFIPTQNE